MFGERLLNRLRGARRISVLTGAGVSAESGVPTFRGADGLWNRFKPEELANVEAFMRNPKRVWEWYRYRKTLIRSTEPNAGHRALVELEYRFKEFVLITQNVDGLHRKAGSRNVLELHGNILFSRCMRCGLRTDRDPEHESGNVPVCACGGPLRPDVVWFGEMLPQDVLERAFAAAEASDVFFSIGTSAVVQPAASLPLAAKRAGAYVVEINPDATAVSDFVDETVCGKSGEVLPRLVEALERLDAPDSDG